MTSINHCVTSGGAVKKCLRQSMSVVSVAYATSDEVPTKQNAQLEQKNMSLKHNIVVLLYNFAPDNIVAHLLIRRTEWVKALGHKCCDRSRRLCSTFAWERLFVFE